MMIMILIILWGNDIMNNKFRLWCKNKKEWESDDWVLLPNGDVIEARRNIVLNPEIHILEQYIGLKDKNKKEIYNGDKVKIFAKFIRTIEFKNGGFGYNGGVEGFILFGGHDSFDKIMKEIEVIGNIHEK